MYIDNTNCKPSLLLNNVGLAAWRPGSLAVVDEVNDLGDVIDFRLTFHTTYKMIDRFSSVSAR